MVAQPGVTPIAGPAVMIAAAHPTEVSSPRSTTLESLAQSKILVAVAEKKGDVAALRSASAALFENSNVSGDSTVVAGHSFAPISGLGRFTGRAIASVMAKLTKKEPNQISVGDKVLNVINNTGYMGTVKKLFADGTALVTYGFFSGLGDSFAPVSHLVKQG